MTAHVFICSMVFTLGAASATPFAAEREAVLALAEHTSAPAMHDASADAATPSEPHLQAVYLEGLPYKGNPTRVFAWLGIPDNRNGKVPGVVLVHGGGGTAYRQWVQKWNDHGFAAIGIAVEGQSDVLASQEQKDAGLAVGNWLKHSMPGPRRTGIYGDSNEPLRDQWMYHAVADTILANSLLRSFPEVDAGNVGVTGISWGGVIAATVMGIDPRFAFAVPVYGCGQKDRADNQYGRALAGNDLYKQVWDPMVRMERAQMPALWMSWPGDLHFPLDCQAATYRAAPGPLMVALIPGMKHGHAPAWNRPESHAFAESVVEGGAPWCREIEGRVASGEGRVKFASSKPMEHAVLISTPDAGVTGSCNWVESPAALKQEGEVWTASAPLPPGSTAWFINVHSGGLTVSSGFQEVVNSAESKSFVCACAQTPGETCGGRKKERQARMTAIRPCGMAIHMKTTLNISDVTMLETKREAESCRSRFGR